jgi:hypothetical protein
MPTFRSIDLVRDRELLDLAHLEAARWLDESAPTPAAMGKLLDNWAARFKLIEIG